MDETVLVYLGLVLVPTAAFYLARRGAELLAGWHGPARPAEVQDPRATVDRLQPHLHRLAAEYDRLEQSLLPGSHNRLRAVSLAYDDTLLACCAALGLPAAGTAPLSAEARLRTEAVLAQHGLTW